MSNAKREQARKDKVIEGSMKMKNVAKPDQIKRLQERGITATGNIAQLCKLAKNKGIPIIEEIPKVIEGWEGKPKGMIQVLSE